MSQPMPIAIIGLAGRFPGANTLREFHQVLREGRDCIAPVSKERFQRSTLPFLEEEAMDMGRLREVDTFDHRFFNISLREAQGMDPHQRLMMELAWEAIESAACPAEQFHESRTAVIVTNATYEYQNHLTSAETHMISGNTQFAVAGRIARFFNMQGPTMLVDTGCSSGLMGVNMAVDQLQLGRVDTALVLGARVVLHIHPKRNFMDVGVTSHDGRTRSFNADSTGSGSAEAIVSVLLKPLEQALKDGDPVQAVILAAGNNSSGQTSASLTATSSTAQSKLLVETWRRAGVDPRGIEYFEAHGSGTQLGDPIEIKGLNLALRQFTGDKHFCGVSSVKTNIGHTDQVAGLSGLSKVVLALRHRELFPSLHFTKPNPFINFDDSAAFVNTELRAWDKPYSGRRRAGVSSYGFAGNNVHVLLEEAPEPADVFRAAGPTIVTVSSRRAEGVKENMLALAAALAEQTDLHIQDVARTQNAGRSHFNHRRAFVAEHVKQLQSMLTAAAAEEQASRAPEALNSLIFLFSGAPHAADSTAAEALFNDWLSEMRGRFSLFNDSYEKLSGEIDAADHQIFAVRQLLASIANYELMCGCGVRPHNLLGVGIGEIAVNVILDDIDLASAVQQAKSDAPDVPADLAARLRRFVENEGASERLGCIELTRGGILGRTLAALDMPDAELYFSVIAQADGADYMELSRQLYEAGYTADWSEFHRVQGGRRVDLPAYSFEKTSCWYREPYSDEEWEHYLALQEAARSGKNIAPLKQNTTQDSTATNGKSNGKSNGAAAAQQNGTAATDVKVDQSDWSETERRVGEIWSALLQRENIGLDDDFFSLGGHSLFGTMVANRIEQLWNIKLYVKDIFTFSTIRALARGVDNIVREGRTERYEPIEPAAKAEYYPLASSQRGIQVFQDMMDADDLTFNLPSALKIFGPLDAERVETCFRRLIERHESFRTSFDRVDGTPVQRIADAADFALERRVARESELAQIAEDFIQPFDLSKAPLMRAMLVQVRPDFHFLLYDFHHIIFDGSSSAAFLHDFNALYYDRELPGLAIHFKDYTMWQQAFLHGEQGRKQAAYWQELFKDRPRSAMLTSDFARRAPRSFVGGNRSYDLGAERATALLHLGRSNSSTLFMTLMSAWQTMLRVAGDAPDVVVGTPIAGRQRVELERIPGMFANMLAIRGRIDKDMTFRDVMADVRRSALEAFDNQDYPFESLVDDLGMQRTEERHPLFDTVLHMFNVAGIPAGKAGEGVRGRNELELREYPIAPPTSRYDMTLIFHEAESGLKLDVEYATSLFKPASIDALVDDLQRLIDIVTADPAVRIGDIDLRAAASPVAGDAADEGIEILEL